MTAQYEAVKRWQIPIQETARILEPALVKADQSSETVRWEMGCLLSWMQQTYTRTEDTPLLTNFQSYTEGFWKGLFTCYDTPNIPRTNNDHERFFRQTKTKHRRTTGRRSWNEHILRSGEFVVLVDDALKQKNLLHRLRSVPYDTFYRERSRWKERLTETTKRRRFRRNPAAYLRQTEAKLCKWIGQP
ncbi:hypothetical protein ERY13_12920 [Paenibacillus mucilaginosus]|nr:hypothetical protein ERY13_07905 [Paenibacillus mucilaginosus]WFA18107.1 hypothetical protein ERY13_12920 [Paenibacillus mucilaginosus]